MAGMKRQLTLYSELIDSGNLLVGACHKASLLGGWWDDVIHTPGGIDSVTPTKLMLIVSEISEAMEGHRKNLMDSHLPNRTAFEVELADAVIRICDLAGAHNLDLGGAIEEKLRYNKQRQDHSKEARAGEHGKRY